MSLCNKCIKPGSCCNNFVLSGHGFGTEYESEWREVGAKRVERFGLPFIPIRFEQSATSLKDTDVPPWGLIRYSCSKVTEDGRCSIYATRPQLCRSYKAGSDGLCVMHGRPPFPPDNARLLVSRNKREGRWLEKYRGRHRRDGNVDEDRYPHITALSNQYYAGKWVNRYANNCTT